MDTAVVIVAAGRGTRAAGGAVPKQYRELNGKPVLERAIACFVDQPEVADILVAIHQQDEEHYCAVAQAFGDRLLPPSLTAYRPPL